MGDTSGELGLSFNGSLVSSLFLSVKLFILLMDYSALLPSVRTRCNEIESDRKESNVIVISFSSLNGSLRREVMFSTAIKNHQQGKYTFILQETSL